MSCDRLARDRTRPATPRRPRAAQRAPVTSRAYVSAVKKERLLYRRNDTQRPCFVEEQLHGAPSFASEIDGILVHVEVDVLVHDLLAHFLGMLANKWQARGTVRERILHASTNDAI